MTTSMPNPASLSTTLPATLWQASPTIIEESNTWRFLTWVNKKHGLALKDYDALWQWSVSELESFWEAVWQFCEVTATTPYLRALPDTKQPGTQWFTGSRLNYAAQIFSRSKGAACAIRYVHENSPISEMSWNDLERDCAALADQFRAWGIQPGDRIAAVLPNTPHPVIALLASAAVGATWSSCAPEMGESAVLDRFVQIAPRVLIVVDGYRYGGKSFDRREVMNNFVSGLPSVEHVIVVSQLNPELGAQGIARSIPWDQALAARSRPTPPALNPLPVPFDHPLWIAYSSGTTGLPKGIVHGHGGIVLQHLKDHTLHNEAGPNDAFCWLSSTGWIVWNMHLSSLLLGSTMVIYDGKPDYPSTATLWNYLERAKVTIFGCGAAFLTNTMKSGLIPSELADLSHLRSISSTGSPLPDEAFDWVYRAISKDIWLAPVSGGTDFAGGFVGGSILLPVVRGEMQCRMLGCGVQAFNDQGEAVTEQVGELVCTTPMPSMPLYFWNDPDGSRLKAAYYDMFPGVWRHGDWIRITDRGSAIIYGRSDSTINRHGIRMGTAEIYRVIEELDEIADSMVVDLEFLGRESWMPLFIVLRDGFVLNDAIKTKINTAIRNKLSARYLPNEIIQTAAIPRTLTGKKMEVPIKRLLLGEPLARIANPDAMANAECLPWYGEYAQRQGR